MVAKATAPRRENVPRHILFYSKQEYQKICHFFQKKACTLRFSVITYFLLTAHGFQKPQSINAGMAELADAYGSGPYDSNIMRVQVSFPAR